MMKSIQIARDAVADKPVTTELTSLALIEVSGDEAESFLQGQFSNDVAMIGQMDCQLNAYCNPKGRVLALVRLVRRDGGFGMIVPADVAQQLLTRLKMFVLRAKVNIDLRPETALLGLVNSNDSDIGTGDAGNGITRAAVNGVLPRQILMGEKQAIHSFLQASDHDHRRNDNLWRLLDILSGIPQVYPTTVEEFIPQMINLDLVGGLSFTKGCYPGQEIVARLRYLGKLKQRMLAGTVEGVENLAPGDPIYSPQRPDQKAGLVVDAVETGGGQYTFSATAPSNSIEEGALLVGSASAPALARIALPYSVSMEQLR